MILDLESISRSKKYVVLSTKKKKKTNNQDYKSQKIVHAGTQHRFLKCLDSC